ncbi:NAD-dependent epimerase/dehydratase family protein [Candidatus Pelagibacter giovannonii]|uniref:NAD-dependent epimerase/dehydratase family protein n=1 Tax=Candidatus Pelagibacter giovannonii TaxID=2563896 RepID=A0A6H1Q343_9PROT|nr:NAD-dependent epimerase/dehydratase family protein [Candidatus Pelagibacter giovannonii]QIZ20793.1 NAD-dependent epimerase/dehydratase family protein [Candidatus Pelagibacter giovannonii]
MKNIIIITGGAGFVGSHLIELLLEKTNKNIISLDNYSSGSKKNHIKNLRVKYFKGSTSEIDKKLSTYKNKIHSLFHFGEFSRIFQSFKKFDNCFNSNSAGTQAVFKFCLDNRIKLIYSATSASLGNHGLDKNLSPYAFTKSKNLELLENLKKWFNFRFEVIYFYNVYGQRHIKSGEMATVIGVFEEQYKKNKPLTIVRPGNQTRRFTHILDTVYTCYEAWKKNKCAHYSISHKKSYSIREVAKMFNHKIKYLKARKGERFASALTNMSLNNKIIRKYGKIHLKDYITSFIKS